MLCEEQVLRASIADALDRLEAAFPMRRLRAVSPLAEGADRLVARAVLERGGDLHVPLPLDPDDYRQDFDSPQSVAEFDALLELAADVIALPEAPSRNEAYEEAGLYVLDHSDAIIALWDGQPAQGRGGTAETVSTAMERGLPTLHILAGNRLPGTTTPTSLGRDQGRLVAHNI